MVLCLFLFSLTSSSPVFGQQPIFESEVINARTPGHQVAIDVDITDASDLYLVADSVDGFSFDWCDWINPILFRADGTEQKLTELQWQSANSSWGTVNKSKNCAGGSLRINGTKYDDGIGTHANSVIHFKILTDGEFTKFTAIGGLDQGGIGQGQGAVEQISVRFLVYTKPPPRKYRGTRAMANPTDHDKEKAISQFDIHPDLEVSLFAAEPMLVNPSNIDIDHLGRVWVCEVVNYRHRRNTRPAGDRLLVLEDTDGDGSADKQTVFYQGPDIDSLHGVCVLGNRALVSAGAEVFFLIDSDGDLKADKKEVLFTGIKGAQHDHGIHAFVFGPDGKFYFNFGNAGIQICHKNGEIIVDAAGQQVREGSKPYRQGMVFRCNPDGSEFETLAWNFRNNWEVCVDSFGRMWQSDNDDDGNRGVRINYVMPFGNYGFRDEITGAGWQSPRTGMAADIPSRHWHQNDPGVIPNLLQTGAGSPTGICVYEGDSLPDVFRDQVIHCDAGPNIVRCYPVNSDGAGYRAEVVNMLDGSAHNKWFRPSDVCVAPDGSLIVADWYDPGVGGHQMGDIEHGRLFRITSKGSAKHYKMPEYDFSTPEGATEALKSPNMAARYLAWRALEEFDEQAIKPLRELARSDNKRHAVRAAWRLSKIDGRGILETALLFDDDPEVACAFLRMHFQKPPNRRSRDYGNELLMTGISKYPAFRREALLQLSQRNMHPLPPRLCKSLIGELIAAYEPGDRWYLEAIGIACEGKWDDYQDAMNLAELTAKQYHDILWRSRFSSTPQEICDLLQNTVTSEDESKRFLRALDFFRHAGIEPALKKLAARIDLTSGEAANFVFVETVSRLPAETLDEHLQTKLDVVLENVSPKEFIRLVDHFGLKERSPILFELATHQENLQAAIDAARVLTRIDSALVNKQMATADNETFDSFVSVLARVRSRETTELLKSFALDTENEIERRKRSVLALAQARPGADAIVHWVETENYDRLLEPAISAALHSSQWPEIADVARQKFPLPAGKDSIPPAIHDLMRLVGDREQGLVVYRNAGTCSKCHVVDGHGVEVGPNLSEIGNKLSRQAMFESILFPSAGISHGYQQSSVETVDGDFLTGIIISETDQFIELKDKEGVVRRIATQDIEQRTPQRLSMMPADLHSELTDQDLADLVQYMMSLKK